MVCFLFVPFNGFYITVYSINFRNPKMQEGGGLPSRLPKT